MLHFCTTSDSNYLAKGLALYKSLKQTVKEEFRLHWLCLDDECFHILNNLRLPEVCTYSLSALEESDEELVTLKNSGHQSQFGTPQANYIWALTPYFINYLLHNIIQPNEKLTYADSDIYFYRSPEDILNAVGTKSVGIHTHRFGGNKKTSDSGWYNVGVMVFTKDETGLKISDFWKRLVMNPNKQKNEYYVEYGKCGDQKYLELFIPLFGEENVCVFDEHPDFSISHRAPWCCDEDNRPVYFYHFSHFTYDIARNWWRDHVNEKPEWKPTRHAHILPYYEKYWEEIKKAEGLIKIVIEKTKIHNV